jgi:preprotein translocase subunit SecD
MIKTRIWALVILIIGIALGYFVYTSNTTHPFKLGLDLSGGTHLVYEADVSGIPAAQVSDSMNVLRNVVEARVNSKAVSGVLGVLEPLIQIKEGGVGGSEQLIVDLPGVTDVAQAEATIGQTPTLEFRLKSDTAPEPTKATVGADGVVSLPAVDPYAGYVSTGLTGRYLKTASVAFDPNSSQPYVSIAFDNEGADLFAKITKENVGKTLAIFLDGAPISTPTIQQEITGGEAIINGSFTPKEAKALADSLSYGALPVPIKLVSSELIGPSLGVAAMHDGVKAGVIGFAVIALFLLFWYRLPGLIAVIALSLYVVMMLTIFKLLHVTLSAAAIAGFIISIGIAVDANVLIFERIKEELRGGRTVADAIAAGFGRAWLSIRDSNISSMITACILFFLFAGTFVRGFAITLLMGILVSMLSAILISRLFLRSVATKDGTRLTAFLFGSGFSSARANAVTK